MSVIGTNTHAPTQVVAGDVAALAAALTGRVVQPGDADWDAVRTPWNLAVDQRPALVVQPENADDIVAVVTFARRNGLRVVPQGTGHHAGAVGDLAGTVLLRTDRLREVTVTPESRTVRVGAGVLWAEVSEALAPYGLTARAGSSGDVGVVGYTLGGGHSWLGRRHGLAASAVTAVELVTGDGVFHRVDADTEPELFWGVRGGGGSLGVVSALEFTALPMTEAYGGVLLFPMDRAAEVFAAYEQLTRVVDESATTCVRLLRLPPLPQVPEMLRGKAFAAVDGVIDAPVEVAERMLEPLRALGPVVDLFRMMPSSAFAEIHMDPPGPTPGLGDGFILDDLPAAAVAALFSVAGPDADCPLLAVDLRHLGGALGRPDPAGGAVDHLPGRFVVFAVGIAPIPEAGERIELTLAELRAALAPWAGGRSYLNFHESSAPASLFYSPETLERLLALLDRYDPDRVVRSAHELGRTDGLAGDDRF